MLVGRVATILDVQVDARDLGANWRVLATLKELGTLSQYVFLCR